MNIGADGADNLSRKPLDAVPVIDISSFAIGGLPTEKERAASQIRKACIDIGFFYITGHGFDQEELEATLAHGRTFFDLPISEKMQIAARNSDARLGFIQTGGLNPDSQAAASADRKERLYLSRELAPGEVLDDESPAGRSQWLEESRLPGFKDFIKRQTEKKVHLARQLARAFSLSLGLPERELERFHDRLGCIHSFNFYPPMDQELADKLWGFSPHTDYGTFTILHQDGNGGLQARNSAGEWIDVPPIEGTFVINVGDLLMRWTNDLYISSLHRVMNKSSHARLSLSFFAYPNPRATIETLATCTSAEPSHYQPVVAGEYIKTLLTQAYETGRTGVSARTAERLSPEPD